MHIRKLKRTKGFKRRSLFFLTYLIGVVSFAQQGPGGVGNTDGASNLILWVNPDDITEADDASFPAWTDISGYTSTLSQSVSTLQPIIKKSLNNGYDVVRFEQTDRRLVKTNFTNFPTTAISGFYVNKTTDDTDGVLSYASTTHNNDFLIFRSEDLRMYRRSQRDFNLDANNDVWNIVDFGWTSAGGISKMSLNGTNGSNVSSNRNGVPIGTGGDLALAGEQDGNSSPYSFDSDQAHQGDFSEVIIFNTYITDIERLIVSNYLSAKYNIAISTNNFYNEDEAANGNFDHNVAGIGQATNGTNHTDSQGTGIVRINTPNDLQNDEFLFWGEDEINADYNFSVVPASSSKYRLDTKWRVSETGDVGTVNFSVNASSIDLTGVPTGVLKLIRSTASDFSTIVQEYDLTLSGGVYSATGVSFNDNDYFTLEIISSTDLSLVKTVNNALPKIGDTIIFTLTLTNNGPQDATGVLVRDLLPSGLQFNLGASNITTGTYNATTGDWDLSGVTINSGTNVSIEIAATITTAGVILNTSEVINLDQQDPNSTPDNGN